MGADEDFFYKGRNPFFEENVLLKRTGVIRSRWFPASKKSGIIF